MHKLGRYEILEELGRGAMGTVYRARDPKIDRIVAIKTVTVLGGDADGEEYRKRFFREAQAAGRLSHPGIVTIHDVGEEESTQTPYIVMEYIAGPMLETFLSGSAQERQAVDTTLELIKQIAEALDYAHSQGIVHRDVKPANIIVTPEGRAKITDFGIAKLVLTQFTMPGETLGTPSYMSPEQATGDPVDGRSDLFSLGIILYRMLAGEKPFTGDTPTAVTFKIAYKDPVPATQVNPSLHPQSDYVLERALAKDPARRYQRGKEFADDLEDLRHGRTPRSQGSVLAEADNDRTVLQKPIEPLPIVARLPRLHLRTGNLVDFAKHLPFKTQAAIWWSHLIAFSKRLPREAQVAIAIIALFLAVFAVLSFGAAKTAKVHISCEYSFVEAELSVWVDDDLYYTRKLTGAVRRRLGLIKKVQGSFSDTLAIAPGKHVVRVHVVSTDEGYDQTKEIEGEFAQEAEKTLEIGFAGRSKAIYLAWR